MTILCQRFVSCQLSVVSGQLSVVSCQLVGQAFRLLYRFSQVIINCSPHVLQLPQLPLTLEVGKTETYSPSQAHFALKSHRLAVQSTVD